MSRVTFGDFYTDYLDISTSIEDCRKVQNVEIVPRKMVEMIIEKCKEIQRDNNDDDDRHECGKWCASDEIKEYAESLLKQFEDDGKI